MGILKVVSVGVIVCVTVGLIIWGFNCLDLTKCVFSYITAFTRGWKMGKIGLKISHM